jgi:FlaA1/EpsC-like NDP-sugar epimerase
VKNNIGGTRMLAMAASRHHAEQFVLISTDKAVKPTSVMGATKRLAEQILQEMSRSSQTHFVTVRFGNVLGSNGSVLPRFLEQIKAGGPVTVTHPEVRRYFMLIPEAVQLVLQAAALGEQGAVYVLDMGEQVKVVDLARNLIQLSGYVPDEEIQIKFIGLRPGEKLFEELVGPEETADLSPVDKIMRVRSRDVPGGPEFMECIERLEQAAYACDSPRVLEGIGDLIPAYQVEYQESFAKERAGTSTRSHARDALKAAAPRSMASQSEGMVGA